MCNKYHQPMTGNENQETKGLFDNGLTSINGMRFNL